MKLLNSNNIFDVQAIIDFIIPRSARSLAYVRAKGWCMSKLMLNKNKMVTLKTKIEKRRKSI